MTCRFPFAGIDLEAGGESVLESAGEALVDAREFLIGLAGLVVFVSWIFFGGLPSDEEDELDESLGLDTIRSKSEIREVRRFRLRFRLRLIRLGLRIT